jgi:hypothetical protein
MIGVMVWKESREHWSIWLTLAAVAVACLVGFPIAVTLVTGPSERDMQSIRETTAAVIACVYGMVCGGMLLAGEREEQTLPFLDTLPCSRLQLWTAKALMGLGLVLSQAILVTILALFLNNGPDQSSQTRFALVVGVLFCGLSGYAWGLLFSAYGRNVLNVVGVAFAGQVAAAIPITLYAAFAGAFYRNGESGDSLSLGAGFLVWALLMVVVPLFVSATVFSRPDALRRTSAPAPTQSTHWSSSWTALFWLTFRQCRGLAIVLAIVSLLTGMVLPFTGPLLWPAATALIGVVCGVSVFGDEQRLGSHRFLGEQRLPFGRVWMVKVGVRLLLAALAAVLVIAPSLVVAAWVAANDHQQFVDQGQSFISKIMKCKLLELRPSWVFITLWLSYGFSVGHLSGLMFRRGLVAMVVALAETLLLVSLWTPSVVIGGLYLWQVAVIPLVLLVTGRMMMRPWTAGRLVSTRPLLGGFAAILFCGLWLAGSLWYRVEEVPEAPHRYDMDAFVKSLPKVEDDPGGLHVRKALTRVGVMRKTLDPPLRPIDADGPKIINYDQLLVRAAESGWHADQPELAAWLDQWFDDTWENSLADAANEPLGLVENPKTLTLRSRMELIDHARIVPYLLVVRGLQQQACGKPEVFIKNLDIGLNLARNLRHKSPAGPMVMGKHVERILVKGLERWLDRLVGHLELAKEANEILHRHEVENPTDPADVAQVQYLMALNTFDQMIDILSRTPANNSDLESARLQSEAEVLRTAWQVPWERLRLMRFLRQFYEGDLTQNSDLLQKAPGILLMLRNGSDGWRMGASTSQEQCQFRAVQLKIALRQYLAEHGKPATTLDVLVEKQYLPSIPLDPYDGKPFRYRLSLGEDIEWPDDAARVERPLVPGGPPAEPPEPEPAIPTRRVPAGQGILWSVGPDKIDNGGRRQIQVQRNRPQSDGEDMIFLVPQPPAPPQPWWP